MRDLSRSGEGSRNLCNTAGARAVYEGQRKTTDRGVVNLTRTGTAGIQRFATTLWSGDVSASWACLATQVQTGLSAGRCARSGNSGQWRERIGNRSVGFGVRSARRYCAGTAIVVSIFHLLLDSN